MKAAVIHGPHKVTCDNVADPTIQNPRDIILKVTATAICGSDTHRMPLTDIARGYEIFKKREDNCVKLVLDPWA